MKKLVIIFLLAVTQPVHAQTGILEIIKAGVKKVIVAVDLKIQRLQNKTIWLQNEQKVLENKMHELKLGEIGDWVEKQRKLYADYFDELWKVKNTVATYQRVRDIIKRQLQLVKEYQRAYALSRQDKNFTPGEINYMYKVYGGILGESLKNLEQVQLVISAFVTQ
nr:conjugal transfer protein TraI [Chitinophagaceae bacterium]